MSLSSLLNATGSTTSAYTYGGSIVSSVSQTVKDALAKATAGVSSSGGSASISAAARIAAAEAVDNRKDFTALSTDVRSALDAQYAVAGSKEKPDMSEMSGRALAAIALNKTGTFSNREIAAARLEMRGRERADFSSQIGSGSGIDALATYNQQIVTQYDDMSQEERDARGWTAGVRDNAESFVTMVNGSGTQQSLFDLLSGDA